MSKIKISAVVLTISDTRGLEDDLSGHNLTELLIQFGAEVVFRHTVSDDLFHIRDLLYSITERSDVNLILTTGGTGFAQRDNTPEATRSVIDREAPGIPEAMRRETSSKTPMAMLSRGIAGIRNQTLIINLPGSPKGVAECFEVIRPILQHAIDQICGQTKH
ncbi:MAG TPA: MogA/MoaB family molybdenum cofactor biosynthesis protein [Pyrinomonadaceae bacterium]|nr:MogA/MoaB family molybdenum cofactor biosynthesis protein [Pyrinomonadaceae bacterium]